MYTTRKFCPIVGELASSPMEGNPSHEKPRLTHASETNSFRTLGGRSSWPSAFLPLSPLGWMGIIVV